MRDDFPLLQNALALPEAFAQSGGAFWDDEHISKGMLRAHLDPAFDGASRLPAFMDRSAGFLARQMPPERFPRLLDLGCGPGLYAQRLAQKGFAVTGLDLSRRSIAYAKEQAEKAGLAIQYHVQDYLQWKPTPAGFDAAVMIYCDYGALPPEGRATVLGALFTVLAPGGRLVMDVFTEKKLAGFEEINWWQHCPKGGFWSEEPYVALFANRRYPGRVSLEQTVLLQDGNPPWAVYIWNQFFTQDSLLQEVTRAGFAPLGVYGDVAGGPVEEGSETLAIVLEKPL